MEAGLPVSDLVATASFLSEPSSVFRRRFAVSSFDKLLWNLLNEASDRSYLILFKKFLILSSK
jgi:hypothetical protein